MSCAVAAQTEEALPAPKAEAPSPDTVRTMFRNVSAPLRPRLRGEHLSSFILCPYLCYDAVPHARSVTASAPEGGTYYTLTIGIIFFFLLYPHVKPHIH
mgnify:FL=1